MSTMLERIQANRNGAGAGNPVSASVNHSAEAPQASSMLDRILQQRQSAARQPQGNLYTQAMQETRQPSSMLERIQQQRQPSYTQAVLPVTADPERAYRDAENRYQSAWAQMQLEAQSGMASAETAARTQKALEERNHAQRLYNEARALALDQRQTFRDTAEEARIAQAEMQLQAESGGLVSAETANRYQQAQRQRQNDLNAYREARNQQLREAPGTNAARDNTGALSGVLNLADNRESSLPGSRYAEILGREDYAALSQAGESKGRTFRGDQLYDYINDINGMRRRQDMAQARGMGEEYGKYSFMTRDEIGVYNYLYATEGKKAANAFLKELEPELDKQWYSGKSRSLTDWTDESDANKVIASAATVAAQPVRSVTSGMALAEDVYRTATGQGINPYSGLRRASMLTNDIRGHIAGDMSEVGSFAYQTAMSALDSTVNAIIAQGVGEGIVGSADVDKLQKAVNAIGSLTMSSEVASLGVAESKQKGYSDIGALSLGLVRGGIEYLSEKVGGDWIIKRLKANPQSLLYALAKAMIPEGTEEVMSDVGNEAVNLIVDRIWGTEESYIGQAYRHFKESGSENPLLDTLKVILQQEALSFAGGAFAAAGSGTTNYRSNRLGLDYSAQQLHTDTDTIVQMMEEYNTENPGAIGTLAELHDAHSVEELRQKVGEIQSAEEAIDAVMRQQTEKDSSPAAQNDRAGREDPNSFDASILFGGNENAQGDMAQGMNTEGAYNGEQSVAGRSENRDAALGAGGEGIDREGRATALRMDAGHEGGAGSDRFQDLVREKITPADLGVTNGSTVQTVEVVDNAQIPQGTAEYEILQKARERGQEVVYIRGTMQIGVGANARQARAYIIGNRVILQVNGSVSAAQLYDHEDYHRASRENPGLNDTIREALARNMSEDELRSLVAQYIQAYDGVYDFSGMTQAEIEEICEEELFADLYAGIDNRGNQEYRDSVRQGFTEAQTMQQQNAEAEKEGTGPPEGRAQAFKGYDEKTGRGIYESNFPENSPAAAKSKRVVELVQNVYSQKPIDLVIQNEDGTTEIIKAKFDPDFDETGNRKTDLGKLAYGNRRGNKKERRVTLNLADDYYQILQDAKYITSGENYDPVNHPDVEIWHYFVNRILYMEQGKEEQTPYSMYIDVKKTASGEYVYTFHAEEEKNNGQTTPQTISATVNSSEDGTANGSPTDSIRQSPGEINPKNEGRASIAGINARTANSTTLQQAVQMERDGADNEQIRQETGWYKGRDGQWRFEIDDSGAKYYRNGDARFRNDHPEYARYQELMNRFLTGNLSADELVELQSLEQTWGREQQRLKGLVDSGHATLDMLLDHPALFEAYPQLREARIRFTDMEAGERGAYNSRTNSFTLSNELRSAPESTLIHEIQHAIQAYEGFSGGSSVEYWENQERSGRVEGWKSDKTKALEQEYTDLMESLPEETRQMIREANQAYADGDFERIDELEERLSESPYGSQYFDLMALEGRIGNARDADRKTSAQFNYMNTAGEIEARDSANRRNMTAEERKNTPPDLGDENTVFAEEGVDSYSIKNTRKMAWEDQIDDYFKSKNKRKLIKSSDTLYLGETNNLFGEDGVNELPLALPQSEITKALRKKSDSNSRSAHDMTETDIRDIRDGIDTARAVLYNPDRNSVVYITSNDSGGFPVVVAAKLNHNLNGDMAHTVTTIHPRESIESLLFNLPASAKIKIKNEFASELASKGILQSPKLLAKVEFIDDSISFLKRNVNADNGAGNNGRASVEVGGEQDETALVNRYDRVQREYNQRTRAYTEAGERGDTAFDYKGEVRRISELQTELNELRDRLYGKAVTAEDAAGELLRTGKAQVSTEAGTYELTTRTLGDGRTAARIERDGKLLQAKAFDTAREAAEYAASYANGNARGTVEAELYEERSEEIPQPEALDALFDPNGYTNEVTRQMKNKAAQMTQATLNERIRRTQAEIDTLKRMDKAPGQRLTEARRDRLATLEREQEIYTAERDARRARRAEKKKKARVEVTGNKPTRSAADAKTALLEMFHTASGERAEVGRQIEQKLMEIQQNGRLTEESRDQLIDALIDSGAVPKEAETTYQEIRNWLRGSRLYVNEHERADFGDNWDSLRRRAWAAGIYLTNNPTDGKIDTANMQLADTFGENLFPTDMALSDMLDNMIYLAERGRTTQQPLAEAVQSEAREMGVSSREIWDDMLGRMDETLRTFAEKAGLEVDLKNRTATELATERKRWEDRMERRAQQRRENEIRNKTLHGLQRLEKLRAKAGPEAKVQADELLRDIDTQARSITPTGLENLQALLDEYNRQAKAAGYVDDENPGNFIRNPYVEEKLGRLSKMHLNDMSISDVIELGRAVSALETTIRNQNRMIGEEFDRTVEETANEVAREVNNAKGINTSSRAGSFLHKWLKEEHLSPRRFLEMLGGWKNGSMKKLSQSLENGQTRMLDFQRRAVQSFDDFMSRKENRKWLETASGKKAKWSTYSVVNGMAMDGSGITGQSIEITPMMKIALYLHSLNGDNLRHIQTGGLIIPNKALYQQGKIQEAYAQGEKVKMQPEAVRAIASTLTQQEKTFASYLQRFFNEQSKQAINEVSLQLDGFERAGVENYFPIESSRSYLKSDVAGEARAQTVEGIGSIANERVHASNPIVLSDASDVLMRQIDKVSRYYGYAIPIRNFQAVNNYVFHEEGNAFAGSIKDTINRAWGAGAENYITKMLADLQSGGRRSDMMGSALAKLRGNLAGATLMLNPSVAVSQAASYPGAAQAVGWDGLLHGLTAGKVDTKLMEKYTPLYWYRNQGNSTQELGDAIKEKGLEQKLPWLLNWIQKMDSATIRRLWAAAEYRVQKDNPNLRPGSKAQIDAGTDPYYKKVAEVFDRAVYDTQPNYTNMERAQILRSDSDVTKFLTMYKTVPLQYYGMMVEATGRLRAAMQGGTDQEKTAARKYFADTMGGLLAANTVYVAMKALFKGFRRKDKDYRDEEGELTAASVSKQLGKDLLEVYAGSVIGGAEAYSAAEALLTGGKWNGPEMSALGHVEDIVNGVGNIFSAIGDEDPRKAAGAVKDAAATIAMAFGVPAKNAETYLTAALSWAFPDVVMEYQNLIGGIDKSSLRGMDEDAVDTAANIILRNRTGEHMTRTVTDELGRLYNAGFTAAVPTAIPDSFTYGETTVEIKDRSAYSDAWGAVVGDNLEQLLTSSEYISADDKGKTALVNRLYEYATVQARKTADPKYSAEGNSTYGWTVKADTCVKAGIELTDAICAMSAISGMSADKDENGNSISGSKKEKVCAYIDGLNLTAAQKDMLYLTIGGYKENSLEYTPWHGYTESGSKSSKTRSGRSGGSRRSGSKTAKTEVGSGTGKKRSYDYGFDISELFPGGSGAKAADASADLVKGIRQFASGFDASELFQHIGQKGRTTVDFEL